MGKLTKSLILIVNLYLVEEVLALEYCRAIHLCKNKECIPSNWRCDDEKDCTDGTDEEGCLFKKMGCYDAIGLSDKNRFKDSQFSSSSTRRGPKYGYYTPNNARLSTRKSQNSGGGWCGSPRNPHTDWIEIDLGRMHRIDKIGTKGLNGGNTWVKSYELKYSNGGELKSYLSLDQTHPKEFPGNTDTDSLVINKLESGIYARKVRIIPKTSKFETCMRFELYGCDFIGNNKQ